MGQDDVGQRVWDKDAERERKRLYRERMRNAETVTPTVPGPSAPGPILAPRVQGLTEEEYVARELAITRLFVKGKPDAKARIERSERYLRWRFREVREVPSL